MAENQPTDPIVQVSYSEAEDTLTFVFQPHPRPAVAEEAGDEIWVRYDPKTQEVITMEVLHFSSRLHEAFGPSLTYTERTDQQRLTSLYGLPGGGEEPDHNST
jgi:hypothetical protein